MVLFFHSAKEGRKINAFKENADICFEMDCDHKLITGEEACRFSFSFRSIVGNGRVVFIDDPEEKKHALSALMKHQTGRDFAFDDRMADSVCVFKIIANEFTGKYHP